MIAKTAAYFTRDIWAASLKQSSGLKCAALLAARVIVLTVRGFTGNHCPRQASALTYFTLLSIVPVAAMMFGIAKGFGFEALLERQLLERLHGQEEALRRIIEFARALIENTRGGLVAGIGVALLFWTVIKLLGNIEDFFNGIWGVPRQRTLARKLSDYLSAVLVCPVLLIVAQGLTVAMASGIAGILERLTVLQAAAPLVAAGLRLLPYGCIWVLFSFLYIFMPNTRVRFGAGIAAGIVAGTVYQVVQWAYIKFQIGIAGYNAIYGGFAALPLFLVWLQTSWTIVLLGAVMAHACQTAHEYDFDMAPGGSPSPVARRLLALRIVHLIVKIFECGETPLTASQIADRIEIPLRLARQALRELTACAILNEIEHRSGRDPSFQPALSTNALTITAVTDALDRLGDDLPRPAHPGGHEEIMRRLEGFKKRLESSPDNVLLREM